MILNKVATNGCELMNDDGKIIAWSVDENWGEVISKAVEMYLETQEDNE